MEFLQASRRPHPLEKVNGPGAVCGDRVSAGKRNHHLGGPGCVGNLLEQGQPPQN